MFLRRFPRFFGNLIQHNAVQRRTMMNEAAASVARAAPFEYSAVTKVTLCIRDKPGVLMATLKPFADAGINIRKIESRPANSPVWDYDFFLTLEGDCSSPEWQQAIEKVRAICFTLTVDGTCHVPWYPKKIQDLDRFCTRQLEYGENLGHDHPGFNDPEYRKRRADITASAKNHRHGQPVPRIDYTATENETWHVIYTRLMELSKKYACREYLYYIPLLEDQCGYCPERIPQLEDISNFLKGSTGFRLRPVSGLLTSRDFLNGLAHRTFHSTQYIRHHSRPFYTPEPDVVHELLGHVPLLADPDFADFSQEVGLASLGASEEVVAKLATLYWFTLEFGVIKQMDSVKAYGAGILSSFGELEYCFSGKPELRPFDLEKMVVCPFPITEYQPVYWVASSFPEMTAAVREFGKKTNRPFTISYNSHAQKVNIHDIASI